MKVSKKTKKIRMFDGLPVIDADEDIILNVTKQDILNSKKKDPNNCAAAKAGKREFHRDVKVFLSRMYVKEGKHWIKYLTPTNAAREITSFDRGSNFEPGEYIFKAATPGQRLGYHSGKNHEKTGTGRGRKIHVTANVRISARGGYKK